MGPAAAPEQTSCTGSDGPEIPHKARCYKQPALVVRTFSQNKGNRSGRAQSSVKEFDQEQRSAVKSGEGLQAKCRTCRF